MEKQKEEMSTLTDTKKEIIKINSNPIYPSKIRPEYLYHSKQELKDGCQIGKKYFFQTLKELRSYFI